MMVFFKRRRKLMLLPNNLEVFYWLPAMLKYKDISGPNGKPDSVVNELDRTFLGSGIRNTIMDLVFPQLTKDLISPSLHQEAQSF
jgi:hypothetical protein